MRTSHIIVLSVFFINIALCSMTKSEIKKEAAKDADKKNYAPISKADALRKISSKLSGTAQEQRNSTPSKASPEETKRLRLLYQKLSTIALTINRLIPILEKNRLQKLRDGTTALDHLRALYGKMEQLKPQFKALEDKIPNGPQVSNLLKNLGKQVKFIIDDEEKSAQETIAVQNHQAKVAAKAKAAEPPVGISNAKCGQGACCDKTSFQFLAAGTPCSTTECVTSTTCLGNSEVCPTGAPLPDGTLCTKGTCLSGVCIKNKHEGAGCTEGFCCDAKTKTFREKGAACVIPKDSCVEPAEFCNGESATCQTTNKPDGSLCKGGVCKSGQCVKQKQKPIKLSPKEKKIYNDKKIELKQYKKQLEYKNIKNMIRKFGVLLWMNNKLDSMEADKIVSDYLAHVPGAPSASQVFEHQRVPTDPNKLWENIFKSEDSEDAQYIQGVSIDTLIAPASEDSSETEAAVLKSGQEASQSSGTLSFLGVIICAIGLVLIVAYLIFGGKKQKEPEVIY